MKINFVSGKEYKKDTTTVYDCSNGNESFIMKISVDVPFSMQLIWDSLDNTDATVVIYGSNDGSTFDQLPSTSSKTLNTANGSFSFIKDEFSWDYMAIELTVNSVTSGNLKLILNLKT